MKTTFSTNNKILNDKYQAAVEGLRANIINPFPVDGENNDMPILIEGGGYNGVWLECGPLEGLVYGLLYEMDVALANHSIFFKYQHEDGYIPFAFIKGEKRTSQIQMVVPIAKTALEVYEYTKDDNFLITAYNACSKWDMWLSKYRDSRNLELCELFCEYDTGHDNSGRFDHPDGRIPKPCPDNDARKCNQIGALPWLAPDLSATLYGGRIALSKMAKIMGMDREAEKWRQKAEATKNAIMTYLFDAETLCFYDLDNKGKYVRIISDVLSRVLCEHVVDGRLFEEIFKRHIINPEGFWTPYPMPSVAAGDPKFNHNLPPNCWGGPTQALTALRAPRWFEYYGKPSYLVHVMKQWIKALLKAEDFMQQMNPWTGEFSTGKKYSPAMCVMIDYVSRLYGVRENAETKTLEWNCRMPEDASEYRYETMTRHGKSVISSISADDNSGYKYRLNLNGKDLYIIKGICRIVTDTEGKIIKVIGTSDKTENIEIDNCNGLIWKIEIDSDQEKMCN